MEERMGLLDDDELAEVEDRLQQQADDGQSLTVSDLLVPEAIAMPLAARTRSSVIQAMADLAASTGMLWDAEKMAAAVRAREELQSTAMDNGVALLHPRRPLPSILAQSILALGVTGQGIPFGGSRQLTDVFCLVCSTDDRSHLRVLARISRLISNESFLADLRASPDAISAHQLIQRTEGELLDD
jgi:PTS system nitrogen regulatory IIA component